MAWGAALAGRRGAERMRERFVKVHVDTRGPLRGRVIRELYDGTIEVEFPHEVLVNGERVRRLSSVPRRREPDPDLRELPCWESGSL